MGVSVAFNGQLLAGSTSLKVTRSPQPSDRASFGNFVFAVRPIGEDFYLLLQDSQSPLLREFKGCTWFPIDAAYKVEAQFSAYKQRPVLFTAGSAQLYTASGDVVFPLLGQTLRLRVFTSGEQLLVMFQDRTSGRETYDGGRYVEAAMPQDGKTILDFNKAYNPYCAVNPYAACPIPPRQNRLPMRIAAGETYAGHP